MFHKRNTRYVFVTCSPRTGPVWHTRIGPILSRSKPLIGQYRKDTNDCSPAAPALRGTSSLLRPSRQQGYIVPVLVGIA